MMYWVLWLCTWALFVGGGAMQTEDTNRSCRQVNPRAPKASRRHTPRVSLCFCLLSLFFQIALIEAE